MADVIYPDWDAPANVRALCTTRSGGVSHGAYASFNLGDHVADDPLAVSENRRRLHHYCPELTEIQWLSQIHSPAVVVADGSRVPQADAAITDRTGLACAVLTADCLPVLFADRAGKQVAAAHAGWRGLLDGVLVNTVNAFDAPAAQLLAWLGPCIRQPRFEVGGEVRGAFIDRFSGPSVRQVESCFVSGDEADKYQCDLAGLAALQLQALGLTAIADSGLCSYDDPRFFSYRRENPCGRFASLIYRLP